MIVPEVIDAGPIRLRRPRLSDAEALFECGGHLEVARYMDWPVVRSVDEIRTRIEQREGAWASGEEFYWVITLPASDRAIGGLTLHVDGHSADLGFFVHRSSWRKGYATEASRAVLDRVKRAPTIWRVWATCDVENAASARVLEKVGLSREGTLRRFAIRPNLSSEPRDAWLYAWAR